ncbi:MAG: PQQ-dependent sugar dehydrogenase [Rhizobiaceae bacterium]|nr:PQQ-dependent sugar dehydrogenase [Rhizobiaceae bacterium]
MLRFFALALSSALVPFTAANAQEFDTQKVRIDAHVVADGLKNPWGMDFLPDGRIIVTERGGTMQIIGKDGKATPVSGLPKILARGQAGLLDVALAPDFEQSRALYFTFVEPKKNLWGTAIARAILSESKGVYALNDVNVLLRMSKPATTNRHFGSRIVFAPDGSIFLTTGDRGQGERAQDMFDESGAVLHINADGSIPQDNPYADGSKGAPSIWSKGHRNIQGATFDPLTGALLTVEHGAKGGDELNRPEAGKNYGWPVISYGVDYSGEKLGIGTEAPGYEQPLYYWDPSIAPSGMVSYSGAMFPEWNGDLLVGSLKFGLLVRLDRDETGKVVGEERMLEGAFGRIRDVNLAPDGSLYLLTDERDGALIRISRAD